ncbi:MAG: hypothetical protein ABII96_10665 [Candidatus Zixiibacteriota bacterium]
MDDTDPFKDSYNFMDVPVPNEISEVDGESHRARKGLFISYKNLIPN